jgi:hypothetical protein
MDLHAHAPPVIAMVAMMVMNVSTALPRCGEVLPAVPCIFVHAPGGVRLASQSTTPYGLQQNVGTLPAVHAGLPAPNHC